MGCRYGDYTLAEVLCGGLCGSAALVLLLLPTEPLRRLQAKEQEKEEEKGGGAEGTPVKDEETTLGKMTASQ